MKWELIGVVCGGLIVIFIIAVLLIYSLPAGTPLLSSQNQPIIQGTLAGSGGEYYWDGDGHRQILTEDIPAGDDYIAIASGSTHNLALRANGSIVCWGIKASDQCDVPPESDFVAISVGSGHSLALKSNGTLVCWGKMSNSILCNPPAGSDYIAIASGPDQNLALRSNGTIVQWGENKFNESMVPSENGFVSIAAGTYHNLALRADGTIACWGSKELCDVPPSEKYIAISAYPWTNHLALTSRGEIIAWDYDKGWNYYTPPGENYVSISVGNDHNLALRADGTIACWGQTNRGECNITSSTNNIAISAGFYRSLAIINPRAKEILAAEWQKIKKRITQSGNTGQVQPQPSPTPVYSVEYVINTPLPVIPEKIKVYDATDSVSRSNIEFKIKQPLKAIEEFKTYRLSVDENYLRDYGPIESADRIVVIDISFINQTHSTASGKQFLQPMYIFRGYVQKDGAYSNFTSRDVPATENLVEFIFLKGEPTLSDENRTLTSK